MTTGDSAWLPSSARSTGVERKGVKTIVGDSGGGNEVSWGLGEARDIGDGVRDVTTPFEDGNGGTGCCDTNPAIFSSSASAATIDGRLNTCPLFLVCFFANEFVLGRVSGDSGNDVVEAGGNAGDPFRGDGGGRPSRDTPERKLPDKDPPLERLRSSVDEADFLLLALR